MIRPASTPVLLLALLLALPAPTVAADPSASPEGSPAPVPVVVPSRTTTFGTWTLVPLLPDEPAYAGPKTPGSLDGVRLRPPTADRLRDQAVASVLRRQGFVVVPSELPFFHMAYASQRYDGVPVFVTTDAAFHTWHLVFDKVLRRIETVALLPRVEDLVAGLVANADTQVLALAGTPVAAEAEKVLGLLQVAGAALDLEVGRLGEDARAEQRLIAEHTQLTRSPLLGVDLDYSLYAPRGHYTKSRALTRYFVAMSVLGQSAFMLPDAVEQDQGLVGPGPLRLAVLAARTLVGDAGLEARWREIVEPTAFLVGLADAYTPFELADAVRAVDPAAWDDPGLLTDDLMLRVADELRAMRQVRIDAERPSVRLMGTRFVVDSWVLDQLIYPYVGTPQVPRLLPSGLDLAAAFGNGFALRQQEAAGETAYPGYESQMALMRGALADRPDDAWGATAYDAWLAAIEPVWRPHGAAFPDFMRTRAWTVKSLQTGLASWAELRHDTLLYVKQAVGEMGGSEPPASKPRHWVEPDPVPFERLSMLGSVLLDGLRSRALLSRQLERLIEDEVELNDFLARIARDELAALPIAPADNKRLERIEGELEDFWWRSGDVPRGTWPKADVTDALVADVASGGQMVLEVGTGWVDRILVLVPDDQGRFQVAMGGVYSYHEFIQPQRDRLTDEAWNELLRNGDAPERPAWQARLFR